MPASFAFRKLWHSAPASSSACGFRKLLIGACAFCSQQTVALADVIEVALVAGGGAGGQHACVGDAPFVAGEAEVARLEYRVGIGPGQVGDGGAARLADDFCRCAAVEVGEDAVQHRFDLGGFHHPVRSRVFHLERVQHGVGGGRALFLRWRRFLGRGVECQRNECGEERPAQRRGFHQRVSVLL
jgi:hypothetical protein